MDIMIQYLFEAISHLHLFLLNILHEAHFIVGDVEGFESVYVIKKILLLLPEFFAKLIKSVRQVSGHISCY